MLAYNPKINKLVKTGFSRIEKHEVDKYYQIVMRYESIDGISISNKNPIKVSVDHSLMVYDAKEKTIKTKTVDEIMEDQKNNFLIFTGMPETCNDYIEIALHENQDKFYKIELNHTLGIILAMYLKQIVGIENIINSGVYEQLLQESKEWASWCNLDTSFYRKTYNSSLFKIKVELDEDAPEALFIQNTIILNKKNQYTIPNELLFSSNMDFVTGILEGFVISEKIMTHNISEVMVHRKLPLHLYTNIFSYLFTKHSVTNAVYHGYPDDYTYVIGFDLSLPKYKYIKYATDKIKKHPWTWHINEDGSLEIDKWKYYRNPENAKNKLIKQLIEMKNRDEIKFVRADEIVASYHENKEVLYDIIVDHPDATNYFLPLGPAAKNSDGDVLAVMGILSEEGNKAAEKLFITNIDRIKDPQNPDEYRNWVQKDAILGLYTLTKGE